MFLSCDLTVSLCSLYVQPFMFLSVHVLFMLLIVSCFTQLNFARCLISASIFYHFLAWTGSLFTLPRFRFPGSQVLYNSLVCCGETLGSTFFAFRTFLAREREMGGGDGPTNILELVYILLQS